MSPAPSAPPPAAAPSPRRPVSRRRTPALVAALCLLSGGLAACSSVGDLYDDATGRDRREASAAPGASPTGPVSLVPSPTAVAEDPSPTVDPDTPSGWGPTTGEVDEAFALAGDLSDGELAATVLMPGFWGYDGRAPSAAEVAANEEMHGAGTAAQVLRRRPFGGVFLRPEVIQEASQIASLTEVLHRVGDRPEDLPLLIGIDQEGGGVQRLQYGVDAVPSAQYVGSLEDPSYAREVARDNGQALRDLGVTVVFAPVADYDPSGYSALGSRTYSRDQRTNTRMVLASMRGYLDAGVLPVLKHFPGIGTVTGDSHSALLHQASPLDEVRRRDLASFRRAIRAGAPMVMTSHVAVDELGSRIATSVNRKVVVGLLREELGFRGVVVTDSQGMAPIFEPFGPGEGAVRSLLAGNDLVLNSPSPLEAFRAVRSALDDGRLPRDRLVEAATRVLALRAYLARLQEGSEFPLKR